ncbi:hypothetical protein JW796_01710 [Candidatus Dojkabacteria bacterium]|nr:hypothetical protein [Candidatus Dojkabacteria bacterium]
MGNFESYGITEDKKKHLTDVMGIKMMFGIGTDATLLMTGVFFNSLLEEDSNFCLCEVVKDQLLDSLDCYISEAHLPESIAFEVRLWGYKKIIASSLRCLSYARDSSRGRLFEALIECAYDYADKYFPAQMRNKNFFENIFGDI